MPKLSEFVKYLIQQIDGIYVWGGQGQSIDDGEVSDAWIRKKEMGHTGVSVEQREKDIARDIKLRDKRKGQGKRAFDCSGLMLYFLQNLHHLVPGDLTANGLKKMCVKLKKAELRDGDLVFKCSMGGLGSASHVGAMANGKIVESQNRDVGVVIRDISATGWNWYGRLKIDWTPETPSTKYVLKRLLKKGCEGDDVKELQKMLIALGYKNYLGKYLDDGDFGSRTKNAVIAFQKNSGFTKKDVDGIVGKKTCKVLGWEWQG